ncbi:hypothetical protein K438DRAFT_1767694 [Mycena galopus ATCC 62051]|nr:hypothetical protein K438DRAFT_1767694 [Mycena galopus ATCC 62051]
MSSSSEGSAYWATLVELEAPTLAPWLFIRDYSRPTSIASALFAPSQLWDHINGSRVIKWIRARAFPQQVDEQPAAGAWDLRAVFQWTKWVAALLNAGQIDFNIYSFTRGSGPAPTLTFLSLVTIGVSVDNVCSGSSQAGSMSLLSSAHHDVAPLISSTRHAVCALRSFSGLKKTMTRTRPLRRGVVFGGSPTVDNGHRLCARTRYKAGGAVFNLVASVFKPSIHASLERAVRGTTGKSGGSGLGGASPSCGPKMEVIHRSSPFTAFTNFTASGEPPGSEIF